MRFSIALLLATTIIETAGYECLFLGHSFFRPISEALRDLTPDAGVSDHAHNAVFSGGASGTPSALWASTEKRAAAQAILDRGNIDLVGMTIDTHGITRMNNSGQIDTHGGTGSDGAQLSTEAYAPWIDYALSKNASCRFMIGTPWIDFPSAYDTATYTATLRDAIPSLVANVFASLQAKYPGVIFIDCPYGLGIVEARLLFEAGGIPDVGSLFGDCAEDVTGNNICGDKMFNDNKGHIGEFGKMLAGLMWLNRIYNVDLSTYNSALLTYTTDITAVAKAVLDAYDAGDLCGTTTCSICDVTSPCSGSSGGTTSAELKVSFTVAGAVTDYTRIDRDSICGKVAAAAGLTADAATCTARPASILVTATLILPPGTTVQSVTNTLHTAIGSTELASSVLSVTVESAPVFTDASGQTLTPTPGLGGGGLSTGAIIGISCGGIAFLAALVFVFWRLRRSATPRLEGKAAMRA